MQQTKMTRYLRGSTNQEPEATKKRKRAVEKKKVTREELLMDVMKVTKKDNIKKRGKSEK